MVAGSPCGRRVAVHLWLRLRLRRFLRDPLDGHAPLTLASAPKLASVLALRPTPCIRGSLDHTTVAYDQPDGGAWRGPTRSGHCGPCTGTVDVGSDSSQLGRSGTLPQASPGRRGSWSRVVRVDTSDRQCPWSSGRSGTDLAHGRAVSLGIAQIRAVIALTCG